MNKLDSIKVSGAIARYITTNAPLFDYNEKEVSAFSEKYGQIRLEELEKAGIYDGNMEKFYVFKKFCDLLKIWDVGDREYISLLFKNAKMLSVKDFSEDSYLKNVVVKDIKKGEHLLTNAYYEKGEIFQYDMPDMSLGKVVPKLAFFDGRISFPCVYEGRIPWVSVCPSEVNSMKKDIVSAHGRVLVLGLGLGYYPYHISLKDDVKSVTIIERDKEIFDIFNQYLLPQFEGKNKIKVILADAFDYLEKVERDEFDFCFADIWEGQQDGAPLYLKIKEYEKKLPYTRFTYWIEDQLRWYIDNIM